MVMSKKGSWHWLISKHFLSVRRDKNRDIMVLMHVIEKIRDWRRVSDDPEYSQIH